MDSEKCVRVLSVYLPQVLEVLRETYAFDDHDYHEQVAFEDLIALAHSSAFYDFMRRRKKCDKALTPDAVLECFELETHVGVAIRQLDTQMAISLGHHIRPALDAIVQGTTAFTGDAATQFIAMMRDDGWEPGLWFSHSAGAVIGFLG